MDPPEDRSLPLFVYGALKPGMPAFEHLRSLVALPYENTAVTGELLVRDGLPLLKLIDHGKVEGFLLRWISGSEIDGYEAVCDFEPREHYQWDELNVSPVTRVNTLVIRSPEKGNPQPIHSTSWTLADDPAFGPGLDSVRRMIEEVDHMPSGTVDDFNWDRFFRSQMAYLLLWSILERLSALCFGPGKDPMKRIHRLYELKGMPNAVRINIDRFDKVSDSRNPRHTYKLDANNAKSSFSYYYQVRSNLIHRGKAVFNEFEKVHSSLKELLGITQQYLNGLREQEKVNA